MSRYVSCSVLSEKKHAGGKRAALLFKQFRAQCRFLLFFLASSGTEAPSLGKNAASACPGSFASPCTRLWCPLDMVCKVCKGLQGGDAAVTGLQEEEGSRGRGGAVGKQQRGRVLRPHRGRPTPEARQRRPGRAGRRLALRQEGGPCPTNSTFLVLRENLQVP